MNPESDNCMRIVLRSTNATSRHVLTRAWRPRQVPTPLVQGIQFGRCLVAEDGFTSFPLPSDQSRVNLPLA